MNRLGHEKSPYLLHHARNPVDWYPWGDEAFEEARLRDVPLFVSIGYSTCHWCHVMAGESFEDPAVAELMNRYFVCVKVDREERPDIDRILMDVCVRLHGRGGWPLNVFLTPDGEPFWAATYIPREGRERGMGMVDILPRLSRLWREDRSLVLSAVKSLRVPSGFAEDRFSSEEVDVTGSLFRASEHFRTHFDAVYGGFYGRPKFPRPQNLRFLMARFRQTGAMDLLRVVETTLDGMWAGGIRDRLGGGFHRYAVDRAWRLPHFEKMLYDQAMLALAYLDSWQLTGKISRAKTVREILDYVLRELQSPEGAFYAAQDADSPEGEGFFYTWAWEELRDGLTPSELERAVALWGVRPEGNFEPEAGQPPGRNLFACQGEMEKCGDDALLKKLTVLRRRRRPPAVDGKILTDWNGLVIAALARGGAVLGDPSYLKAAEKAASFFVQSRKDPVSEFGHSFAGGEWAIPGFLEDWAFLIWGLIELHQASLSECWLTMALGLTDRAMSRFDRDGLGPLSPTAGADPWIGAPAASAEEGPYPSGNAAMARNLILLGHLCGRSELIARAGEIIHSFDGLMGRYPWQAPTLLEAAMLFQADPVLVELQNVEAEEHPLLTALRRDFAPLRFIRKQQPHEGVKAFPLSAAVVRKRDRYFVVSGLTELKERLWDLEKEV